MASDGEACCESDPNFAVICGFLEKFGVSCGLASIDFLDLQDMLENNQEVPQELVDLHVKLLRKARKSVSSEKWERAIIKFCHGFCTQDAWEIERFGYKKARLSSKLRILKKDITFNITKCGNERIFGNASHIIRNREGLVSLITELNDGKETVVNEDSNSLESEKPVVDTGQIDTSNPYKIENGTPIELNPQYIQSNGTEALDTTEKINVKREEIDREEQGIHNLEMKEQCHLIQGSPVLKDLKPQEQKFELHIDRENIDSNKIEIVEEKGNLQEEEKIDITESPEKLVRVKLENEVSSVIEPKKEVVGIKEKYIRSDSTSSSTSHRKAVDSAGFNVHTNYLKRPPHEEEMIEEPTCVKRPRFDRPTLLGNKKKKAYSDEDDTCEDSDHSIKYNEQNSPIVSDVIEESVMHFVGEGTGADCETGNEKLQASDQTETNSTATMQTVGRQYEKSVDNVSDIKEEAHNSSNETEYEVLENDKKNEELSGKKSLFFFGPGCLQVKPTIGSLKKNEEGDVSNMVHNKAEETSEISDKSRSLISNRRKLDKPIRKLSGIDYEHKESSTTKHSSELQNSNFVEMCSKENSEVQNINIVNTLMSNNVPKSINISETKEDSYKNYDKNPIDVPLNKADCTNSIKSDKGGLPILKYTSTLTVDKPKSKLENVLEKINQGKITKKTEGLDLGKCKNNLTVIENKVLEISPCLKENLSSIEATENKVALRGNSKETSFFEDVSNADSKVSLSFKETSEELNININVENTTDANLLSSDKLNFYQEKTRGANSFQEERTLTSKESVEIPTLEDNSIISVILQREDANLSPPSLQKEVSDEEQLYNKNDNKDNSDKKEVGENKVTEAVEVKDVAKRWTRRTRSNTELLGSENDKEKEISEVKLKAKKKDELPKCYKDLEALATNRELRERKPVINMQVKETKPKNKLKKSKKDYEGKKSTYNNKERKGSSNKTQTLKGEEKKIQSINLEDVEDQIIRPEIRPLKKLKLTKTVDDTVDNSEVVETMDKKQLKEGQPVVEPKCVKKKVALLTDDEKNQNLTNNIEQCALSDAEETVANLDDSNSSDIMIVPDSDPLACSEDDSKHSEPVMTLATFKIDVDDNPFVPMRITRKRAAQQSVDTLRESTNLQKKIEEKSKRPKMKRKRSIDQNVRRSIEAKKAKEISTSEDDNQEHRSSIEEKTKSECENVNSDKSFDNTEPKTDNLIQLETKEKKTRQIRKTLLGLEISQETEDLLKEDAPMGVRQSRRIAQIKIKEEAERRKLEEMTLHELKEERIRKGKKDEDKDYKLEKKKRNKHVVTEDETTGDGEFEEKKKKKKRRKHRDPRKQFDVHNPWKSSSGSSSSSVEEEEEEIEEDDDHPLVLKSDHEFSPESDLEGVEVQPLKRARTAKKVKNLEAQLIVYDKKINKKVMENRRKERLAYVGISLDNVLPTKECDEYKHRRRRSRDDDDDDDDSDESDSEDSSSGSESITSSISEDEPIYQLRKRRQAHSYRFNDYDDLINSAIQDEMDAVKGAGNQGRGKDIATIVNAEKQENELVLKSEPSDLTVVQCNDVPTDLSLKTETVDKDHEKLEPLPPVVPLDYDRKHENESDEDIIRPVRKMISKKKHRKLNSLDVSSGDDAESDEDFKGSSTSYSDDEDDYAGSESSEDLDSRKGRRYRDSGPIRRSTRARISRYDRDFIDDDSDSDGENSKRKKNKLLWEESESEESDRSWGRRKRKAARKKPLEKLKRLKKKKKKRSGDDSDPEVFKKRPNIKFGGLNDDEEIGRRTRGKKINYLEALGTDSDDDVRRKPVRIEESDDEYAVHEDEDLQHRLANDNDSDESGVENVLRDLPLPLNPKPKSKGRGKAGLKIPRKPKDQSSIELFPPLMPDLCTSTIIRTEIPVLQQSLECQNILCQPILPPPLMLGSSGMLEDGQDIDDEPNPIEQINKNVEQMNEQEMEKMMEEEDYANRQLQLVALQIEKEKKRKERERLEKLARVSQLTQIEPKIPKKRGRKPKNQVLSGTTNAMTTFTDAQILTTNNSELSEPPGVILPMFGELTPSLNADGSPKKRRGRGKGKKTLAAEAAAAAACNTHIDMDLQLEGPNSTNSNTVSPAPDSPMHGSKLGIAAPPQPFSQSQPAPSVITRMLQSQPGQTNFNPAAISKYFGGSPNDQQHSSFHPGASVPRGTLPGPFQQSSPDIPHFPVIRSGPPPVRLHSPGATNLSALYHPHRSMDPSPSGGGPINVPMSNRDRQSPALVSPSSNSPLSKGDPTPPPYTRPPVSLFPSVPSNSVATGTSRQLPMVVPHIQQHRGTTIQAFHPSVPPNYHYGSYPPPPINSEENQTTPNYPASYPEQYPDGGSTIQPPEAGGKSFEEGDEGGEFVGLVSYFSSQREDDLDT
ncbi:hypothetical protein FQA39_LY17482 [Lamprigera yunnana]|nr:hypothetical protein FQA39_LY17482 [Lamprigera yunnana]